VLRDADARVLVGVERETVLEPVHVVGRRRRVRGVTLQHDGMTLVHMQQTFDADRCK